MFDHAFITEEISLASWSTASSDTAINDWPVEMEFDSNDLQPAVVLQRLSPSIWPSSDNSENDVGSTDAVMQPVVMLERLPSLQVPSEINSNSDMIDQHISFQWTRTVLGPLPIMAESPQPSSITVSDNWSFQEMSATTTWQPVVILQRLPSPNWSFQQATAVAQPVVVLQRLNIPLSHLSDNGSFQEEDSPNGLKACSNEPTVVLQRLSPFFQHPSYANFSTKEMDSDITSSQNFPVTNSTWSSSSSSTGQPDIEEQNDLDTFIKQPIIVLEQLPLLNLPSNEVTIQASAPEPL